MRPQKARVKICETQGGGQEMAVMVYRLMIKILITTIQVPLGLGTKFTRVVVVKIFTINLPSQPFLGHHLGFHIFFHPGLFWAALFFLQLGCFALDITSFCIASHKAGHKLALVLPFNLFFFFSAGIVEQRKKFYVQLFV